MADLEILFATRAELEGGRQFADALEKNIGKMKAAGHDTAALSAQHHRLQTALQESANRFDTLEKEAEGARRALESQTQAARAAAAREETEAATANASQANQEAHSGGTAVVGLSKTAIAAAAATVAVAGLAKILEKSIEEFSETERVVTALDTALAQHGHLVGEVREHYQKLAGELEETTAIADEEWMRVLGTLTKFGVAPAEIDKTTEAVKNLAGFLGGDITTAAFMVGKAFQGQYVAFTRVGFQFDETATKAEKLESLFEQLAQRGGGQLEARANTLSGRLDGLKVAASNVWEGMGNLASRTEVAQIAMEELTRFTRFLADLFPDVVEQNEKLKNKSGEAAKAIREQAEAQAALVKQTEATVKAMEAEIHAIERRKQLSEAVNDARTATKMAEIDLAEAEGKISPEDANLQKTHVRNLADVSAAENERLALLLRRDQITKAFGGASDPETRARLQRDLEDVNAGLTGNEARLGSLQTTGRAGIAGAEAGIRRANEKRREDEEREAERQRRELERATQQEIRRLTSSTRGAGAELAQGFNEQRQAMEDMSREIIATRQEIKQIRSRMAAGR